MSNHLNLKKRYSITDAINKGIVLDILFHFTTKYGTTKNLTWEQIRKDYKHIIDIDMFLNQLIESQLIVEKLNYLQIDHWQPVKSTRSLRLAHDSLATVVRNEFLGSDNLGQKALKLLEQKTSISKEKDYYRLSRKELKLVSKGISGMRIMTEEEIGLIEYSKSRIRKINNWIISSITLVFGFILVLFYLNITPELVLVARYNNPLRTQFAHTMALSENDVLAYEENEKIFFIQKNNIIDSLTNLKLPRVFKFVDNDKSLIIADQRDSVLRCWNLINHSIEWEIINPDHSSFFAFDINKNQIVAGDEKGKIWLADTSGNIENIYASDEDEGWGMVLDIDFFKDSENIIFCYSYEKFGIHNFSTGSTSLYSYPHGEFNSYKHVEVINDKIILAHYVGEPVASNNLTIFTPLDTVFTTLQQNNSTSYSSMYQMNNSSYLFTSDYDGKFSLWNIDDNKIVIQKLMSEEEKYFYEGSIKGCMNEETGSITVLTNQYIFLYQVKWVTFFSISIPFAKFL